VEVLEAFCLREGGRWAFGADGQILVNTGPQGVVLAEGGKDGHRSELGSWCEAAERVGPDGTIKVHVILLEDEEVVFSGCIGPFKLKLGWCGGRRRPGHDGRQDIT
jgi:hypothetical protein